MQSARNATDGAQSPFAACRRKGVTSSTPTLWDRDGDSRSRLAFITADTCPPAKLLTAPPPPHTAPPAKPHSAAGYCKAQADAPCTLSHRLQILVFSPTQFHRRQLPRPPGARSHIDYTDPAPQPQRTPTRGQPTSWAHRAASQPRSRRLPQRPATQLPAGHPPSYGSQPPLEIQPHHHPPPGFRSPAPTSRLQPPAGRPQPAERPQPMDPQRCASWAAASWPPAAGPPSLRPGAAARGA